MHTYHGHTIEYACVGRGGCWVATAAAHLRAEHEVPPHAEHAQDDAEHDAVVHHIVERAAGEEDKSERV